jgi:hypothetical protein
MNKYQSGKVYALKCNKTNKVYIGSTCNELFNRLNAHKANYKKYLTTNHNYITAYDILKEGDYKIELLELFPCNTHNELLLREKHYVQLFREDGSCINKNMPLRSQAEYYHDNQGTILKKLRDAYNADKTKKQSYYQMNKERIKEASLARYYSNKCKTGKLCIC